MKRLTMIAAIAAFGAMAAGCNNPEPPAKVEREVSKAQAERNTNVAEARKEGNQEIRAQRSDVADARATKEYEVALAKVEGDYEVATKACNVLAGSAQADCKTRAEADYKAEKSKVELLKPRG